MTIIPFRRNQLSVPSQQRVRRDPRFEFLQHFTPEQLSLSRESAALHVRETDAPATQALLQDTVLLL
jgi:hypothetical protein